MIQVSYNLHIKTVACRRLEPSANRTRRMVCDTSIEHSVRKSSFRPSHIPPYLCAPRPPPPPPPRFPWSSPCPPSSIGPGSVRSSADDNIRDRWESVPFCSTASLFTTVKSLLQSELKHIQSRN